MIGYEGEWRKAKTAKTDRGPMGGLAIVVNWEEGGTARFPSGDELLLGTPDPDQRGLSLVSGAGGHVAGRRDFGQ